MRQEDRPTYDNPFYHNNVYGHALELLTSHMGVHSPGALHVDVGCGFGRIAEPLVAKTGLHYLGLDAGSAGVQSLKERGFEAYCVWLAGEDEIVERLQALIAGRPVAAISFLDILEHLADGDAALRAIARIAKEHSALVVVSTPNVAHGDIGHKLALGRWDYTETGLLDHTHLRLFDNRLMEAALGQAGLHIVAAYDVEQVKSDQHFPADHPALATGTTLHSLLHELRARVDGFEYVNQFVRLCVAGPKSAIETYTSERETARPFLSIVIRTQGTRLHTLVEALTSLAGQTDVDFEVLVMGHMLSLPCQLAVERTIEDSPEWLRKRTRLVLVSKGNRTHPLNVGFEEARGQYIAILDDDDIAMAHWVETFRQLAEPHPGRVLRASTVRQDVNNVLVRGKMGLRAEGEPLLCYPQSFDLLDHLPGNQSPPVSLAFPRGAFHDLKIRFDEELTTTEDWDFLLRTAAVVGVSSGPEITSVYRWWLRDESSRTVHPQQEWQANHRRIFAKMDAMHFLFPAGVTAKLRALLSVSFLVPPQEGKPKGEAPGSLDNAAALQAEAYGFATRPGVRRFLIRTWARLKARFQRVRHHADLQCIRDSKFFNPHWYLFAYPDIAKAGLDPEIHYLIHGGLEGRHPGPYFDGQYYLDQSPDVAKSGMNPLVHYVKHGRREKRNIRQVAKLW